eukprot:3768113-Heterocapsa_arctica.AAC.1
MQFAALQGMSHLLDRDISVLSSCVHLGPRFVSTARWEPLGEVLASISSAELPTADAVPGRAR